jgi:hypothetical protein
VAPERCADIVYRRAKLGRLRQEIRGKISPLGRRLSKPVGLLDGQSLGVPQPFHDVRGLAKMVLMRGKAAAGFGVGKVEREIVGDQVQRASARGEVG